VVAYGDQMYRWAPGQVNTGQHSSAGQAVSELVSRYLETTIAAEQKDLEEFFSRLVPRSRVTEVVKALLPAREFSFIQVSGKTMLRLSPRGVEEVAPAVGEKKIRPWQARGQGRVAS